MKSFKNQLQEQCWNRCLNLVKDQTLREITDQVWKKLSGLNWTQNMNQALYQVWINIEDSLLDK